MNLGLTPFVQRLIIINIVFFLATTFLAGKVDLYNILGLHGLYSDHLAPYQFVSYMFMHADFTHLLGNMIGLVLFGRLLEIFLGPKKFLILYFVCGIGAGFLYWALNSYEVSKVRQDAIEYVSDPNPDAFNTFINSFYSNGYESVSEFIDAYSEHPDNAVYIAQSKEFVNTISYMQANIPLIGASGAVFGILMAMALLFPNTEINIFIPVKVKYLATIYGLYEIYSLYENRQDDNVAHFAHLAGMIFAFILVRYWKTNRNSFY
ncbi:MAG: rhomboid family intramembrane serine protease [Cytophaga sp.]|uniref:rhomboid family intramembrane serine protease n=1 Tax=Cytophaga sp. TaxID=29535 RepID=UPI003F818833